MREYINIYQLDDIGNDKVRFDDYLLVSQNALSYKFRVGEFRDFVIQGIDTTLPIYNANMLMGYGIEFTEPLSNYELLTFDALSNSWVNRELDIDAVFRFDEYEPTKFLRLDVNSKVITSDVYVSDLVVDTPDKADHFLQVADNGSDVIYVDVYAYIDNEIETKSDTFIPLLNAEITRATNEEARIELLITNEIDRSTNEDLRIETKFDTLINDELSRLDGELSGITDDLRADLDNEILRATNEEVRIETELTSAIEDEEDRAVEEERRLEELIRGAISTVNELPNILFPVGSVIMRPVDPGFGISNGGIGVGNWEKIEGVSLIGNGSYTDSNNKTRNFTNNQYYGTYEHRLDTSEIPAHSHVGSTGSSGSHGHSASTGSAGSHSHSGSSTGSAGLHSHPSSSTSVSGSHTHTYQDSYYIEKDAGRVWGGDGWNRTPGGKNIAGSAATDTDNSYIPFFNRQTQSNGGSHSHTVNIASAGSHTHSLNITNDGSHSHSVSIGTNGSHTHSVSVGNTGGSGTHNNLHPVLAVPMWIRIS